MGIASNIEPARLSLGDWWKDEDLPLTWDRLFPGGPLRVEVGFGGGEFLLAMARSDPGSRFVGVERFAEGHRRLMKAAERQGIGNVIGLVGDAYVVLNLAFHDASLASVTVNFSDPWPKSRHAARRLLSEEFLRIAARKLAPGGTLWAATDDPVYARQAVAAFGAVPALECGHPGMPWLSRSPHPLRTRYETKWMAEGRPLHYFIYRREER